MRASGKVENLTTLPENVLTQNIIGAAIEVHRALGPGLLENAYALCLAREFTLRSICFEQEKQINLLYKGVELDCGYRLDFLVENCVVVELKTVESLLPVHTAQALTYMKLTGCHIGLLMNFNVSHLKYGLRRIVL